MTIFDLIRAQELTAYWETYTKDREPYLGEELFPNQKKLGLELKWIKGSMGLPVVLKPSAYDVTAVPRERIGFEKLSAEMPFFKESVYIDEVLRQELNMVLETGNQVYIDAILNRVFADEIKLLEGASAQRERMRMMLLTSGAIDVSANGQAYSYDYQVPDTHKGSATVSWSSASAAVIDDIREWQDTIEEDTGVRPRRAVCSRKTWRYMLNNDSIKKSVFVLSNGQANLSDERLRQYLMQELELEVVVYGKRYRNEKGVVTKYMPDDTFVLFPEGDLGYTWFGTTPEESDLMSGSSANVSITDVGVAVTTIKKEDPVNVETKVTMISMPSFESADQIFIADVIA